MKRDKSATAAVRTRGHLLVVEARFYGDICDELARGATAAIERAGASWERLAVPGALEIPGAIAIAAKAKRFDGYVALGCVLRGETSHYDIVANESARGIMDLTMTGLAIGNGILTCENEAQAWARARVAEMDKGGGAADAALAMIRFARGIGKRPARS
ncbi:MAG: 6,7-dimethyl-8-ribityllumazine synthase [Parvibaculaceae bacterium]